MCENEIKLIIAQKQSEIAKKEEALKQINEQLLTLFRRRCKIYSKIRIINSEIALLQNRDEIIHAYEISYSE